MIAEIARVSRVNESVTFTSANAKNDENFRFAVSHGALLTEPRTEVLNEAFVKTCQLLLEWLSCWSHCSTWVDLEHEWIHNHTDSQWIVSHFA